MLFHALMGCSLGFICRPVVRFCVQVNNNYVVFKRDQSGQLVSVRGCYFLTFKFMQMPMASQVNTLIHHGNKLSVLNVPKNYSLVNSLLLMGFKR